MAVSVCLVLGLLLWSSSGVSSSQTVFIQTKQDLLMTVTEEVDLGDDTFYWKYNKSKNIVRLSANKSNPGSDYKKRIEFFSHNLSLVLKNVQLSDSGIYTAVVTRDRDTICAKYEVTVQAPVSPVTVTVGSVSHSPESCNFTVSCTTDHFTLSHSFTCNTHSCEDQRGHTEVSPSAASLHLYLTEASIICNHSNQVSWTKDTWDIERVCPTETGSRTHVFIETKQDLTLTVREKMHLKYTDVFQWKCNDRNIMRIFAYTVSFGENYRDRVEFFQNNLSLILRNVQRNDSGIYTAVVSGERDVICAEYDVTVHGLEEESVVSVCELKTAVFSVGLLLMVSAVISVHVMEYIKKKNM